MDTMLILAVMAFGGFGLGMTCQWFRFRQELGLGRQSRDILENTREHLWATDRDGNFMYLSPSFHRYFGSGSAIFSVKTEGTSDPIYDELEREFMHPEDQKEAAILWRKSLETGEPFYSQHRLRKNDGTYHWFKVQARPVFDQSGNIVAWHGCDVDIDDLKRLENSLRETDTELTSLINTLPAMIWAVGADRSTTFFNKTLREFTGICDGGADGDIGISAEDAIALLVHPEERSHVLAAFLRGAILGEPFLLRYRLKGGDGKYKWFEGRTAYLREQDGSIRRQYGILVDVDDEVKARQALRLAQEKHMRAAHSASLAHLSAAMAHEINQPLAAVAASSSACMQWLSADPPNCDRARLACEHTIQNAIWAGKVVERIRALFRHSPAQRSSHDLNAHLVEVCKLMYEEAKDAGVTIRAELTPKLPIVLADRVQIGQVLVNLIRNAIEASVELPGDDHTVFVRTQQDDGRIIVQVEDRGVGISDMDQMFDAFFTTKPNGMGMGLSICRTIVEAHKGDIWCEVGIQKGAIVSFSLPLDGDEG